MVVLQAILQALSRFTPRPAARFPQLRDALLLLHLPAGDVVGVQQLLSGSGASAHADGFAAVGICALPVSACKQLVQRRAAAGMA
jgi:hypothetical protein